MAADEAYRGVPRAAERYLQGNRAINDINLSPVNSNAKNDAEGERLTDELRALHSRAFALSEAVWRNSR